jgi:amino acid permease
MKGTVGLFGTCFAMLKVFLGIGILATPQTFQAVGLIGGFLGLCLIGLMNAYTMRI